MRIITLHKKVFSYLQKELQIMNPGKAIVICCFQKAIIELTIDQND